MGRPSLYTQELGDEICARVITRSLHAVCQDDDLPHEATIYEWLGKHKEFAENYARARQLRAYRRAEDVDKIMDDLRNHQIDHNQARIMLDAIKWQTGKENPKNFGDRLELAGDKSNPLTVNVVRFSDKTDESK